MKNIVTISSSLGDASIEYEEGLSVEEIAYLIKQEVERKGIPIEIRIN